MQKKSNVIYYIIQNSRMKNFDTKTSKYSNIIFIKIDHKSSLKTMFNKANDGFLSLWSSRTVLKKYCIHISYFVKNSFDKFIYLLFSLSVCCIYFCIFSSWSTHCLKSLKDNLHRFFKVVLFEIQIRC